MFHFTGVSAEMGGEREKKHGNGSIDLGHGKKTIHRKISCIFHSHKCVLGNETIASYRVYSRVCAIFTLRFHRSVDFLLNCPPNREQVDISSGGGDGGGRNGRGWSQWS